MLVGSAVAVLLTLPGCPVQREETFTKEKVHPSEVKGDGPSPALTPLSPPKKPSEQPRDRYSPARLRRAATSDGSVDRREAIALAKGPDRQPIKKIQATLRDGYWEVTITSPDGCQRFARIDARTGESSGGGGGCY